MTVYMSKYKGYPLADTKAREDIEEVSTQLKEIANSGITDQELSNAIAQYIANNPIQAQNGKKVELQKTSTHIQWKYEGDTTWINLVALSDIRGEDGRDGQDIISYKGLNFSILSDSYSTYEGWVKPGNAVWYKDTGNVLSNNVNDVSQMWWYKLAKMTGMNLLINDSYSGASVCNTGYQGSDASPNSFITRMVHSLGADRITEVKPGIIFIFGGTNDDWDGAPVGSVKYSGWTTSDKKNVLTAFCYMLDYVKKYNPSATIVNIINTGMKSTITTGMKTACEHYGVIYVELVNIDKQNGHPSQVGMTQIAQQIVDSLDISGSTPDDTPVNPPDDNPVDYTKYLKEGSYTFGNTKVDITGNTVHAYGKNSSWSVINLTQACVHTSANALQDNVSNISFNINVSSFTKTGNNDDFSIGIQNGTGVPVGGVGIHATDTYTVTNTEVLTDYRGIALYPAGGSDTFDVTFTVENIVVS